MLFGMDEGMDDFKEQVVIGVRGTCSEIWLAQVFKVNIDIKNHFVARLSPKIPLWLSPQEAFFRREIMVTQT